MAGGAGVGSLDPDLWLDQLVVMNDNILNSEFALDIRSVGYCSSVNTRVAVIQHLKPITTDKSCPLSRLGRLSVDSSYNWLH